MKKILAVLLVIALIVSFAACGGGGNQPDSGSASGEGGDQWTMGVLMKTMSDTFSNALGNAILDHAAATYDNVDIILLDAQADINQQISQAEDLIARNVDIIILNAEDTVGSAVILDMAEEAGIPLIEVNTKTIGENYLSFVGSEDIEAGEMMGNHVLELLGGSGNVAVLEGIMGQSPQIYRMMGLEQTILAADGINEVARLTAEWQRDRAMSIVEDWLSAWPDLDAVLAHNDDMAMGALQAAESMGRPDLIIMGVDAIPDAVEAVAAGRLTATVLQDANAQASSAVDVAYRILNGETVSREYRIPFQLVTIENASEFIN